ncbi:MAG: nitrate/nitrite transporter [Candidatus Bathyarchaeia archaeon]
MTKVGRPPPYRWMILVLAFLTTLIEHLLLFSSSPLVLQIMPEMNLTYAQAGFILPMSFLMITLLRIPWGLLGDRIGVKSTMGLAIATMSASGLLRGFAVNYWTLLMFQAFLGVGVAAIMPCLPKLTAAWFPSKELGLATGIYVAGFSIGNMLGLGLTPHVLAVVGTWRGTFHVYGVWGLMLAAVWWFIAREPTTHKARSKSSLRKDIAAIVRMKDVWVLTGLLLCAMGSYDTVCYWLPSMLELRGVPSVTAGLVASMLPLGFLVASLTIGTFSDRIGLRKPFIWILGLVSGPAILAIEKSQGFPLWVTVFLSGFCTIGVLTLVLLILAELPEVAGFVASASGWVSSLANIGSVIMLTVVGYVKDVTGSFLLAVIMIAVVAEMTLVLGFVIRETGKRVVI